MKQSLASKYRPNTFDEVLGQTVVTKILKQVVSTGNFKNSILFSGSSGCGKTTLARCFAKAINKGNGDIIEIDAASNNGVDNVRAIIDAAKQRSLTGEYKVFLIDECHAISTAGWQAFLKGIEEPSPYTIFIFCTTEPNKIPITILNRVQRYNIAPIPAPDLYARLCYICKQEGFSNYEATCDLISKIANGGARDAITLLEQCADYSADLSLENAKQVLGELQFETMLRLTNALIDGNEQLVLQTIEKLFSEGKDLRQFISTYLSFLVDMFKYILFKDIRLTNIPAYLENNADLAINVQYTAGIENGATWFSKVTDKVLALKAQIKADSFVKTTIEITLLQICRGNI